MNLRECRQALRRSEEPAGLHVMAGTCNSKKRLEPFRLTLNDAASGALDVHQVAEAHVIGGDVVPLGTAA